MSNIFITLTIEGTEVQLGLEYEGSRTRSNSSRSPDREEFTSEFSGEESVSNEGWE